MSGNLYVYLGIYFSVLIGIGLFVSHKETKEDFLIGGRKIKGRQILLSKFAGAIGANWFVTYTAYAYDFGFGVFTAMLGLIIGYFLFAYRAAPKIYQHSKQKKFYTQGDFVFSKTKHKYSKLATNIMALLIQCGWLLIGVVGSAKIISHFGLLSYEIAILLTASILLAYILLSGFKAVIITDVFQSLIILVLIIFLSFNIVGDTSVLSILSTQTGNIEAGTIIGFLLYGSLSVFALSDRYQLCFSAKNEKNLKRGIGFAVVPIVVVAFFLLIIGLFMYSKNPHLDSGLVFLEALKYYVPSSLLSISIVMFFAGLMSSSDTAIYSIVSHYVFSRQPKNPIKSIRIATFIILLVVVLLSYFFHDIVEISIVVAGFTLCLSIPMVYLLSAKNVYKEKFLSSLLSSIIFLFIGIVLFGVEPVICVIVLIGGVIGLCYPKRKQKKL